VSQYVVMFVLGIVYLVADGVTRAVGGPRSAPFIAIGACGLGATFYFLRRGRHAARVRARATPSEHGVPDERYRVRCVGWEVARASFDRLGPVEDRPFEPRVFFGFFAVNPAKRVMMAWMVLLAVLMSSGLAWVMLTGGSNAFIGTSLFPMSAIVGAAIVAVCLPTYVRVVPGRVDVLHYTAMSRRARRAVSHDLRRARVLVDLNSRTIKIEPPPDDTRGPAVTRLWFGWVPRGEELAHAVLEAAISSAPAAELPEDELVG
jgi:hypothetical protein